MADKAKTTKTAGFEILLQNTNNVEDTTTRTVSFDLPYDSTIGADNLATIASTYFAVAGMSNVFQPAGWRDYEGAQDVFKMVSVTPILTEKTVTTGEAIFPPSA